MQRITKKPDVRRNEILEAAKHLFDTRGYSETSINEIVDEVNIAKGTLYYYFKTKEDILSAVVEAYCDDLIEVTNKIADEPTLTAVQKVELALKNQTETDHDNKSMLDNLHKWSNIQMHQRIFVYMIENHSPVIARIIEQGVREGVFHVTHPLEAVRFLLAGYRMLFDPGHFHWSGQELSDMAATCQEITECALGAEKGTFAFLQHL